MRIGRIRPHYGSLLAGYPLALALAAVAAVARQRFGPAGNTFPFVFFYPVIFAVSFFWGVGPGAAALCFSAISIPVMLPALQPSVWNWASLAVFGIFCVGLGSILRDFRESNAEAARMALRFRAVTDHMSDWIFFLDCDGKIDYANRAAGASLECEAASLSGRHFNELIAPECRARFADHMQAAIAGSPVPAEECRMLPSSGQPIPVEMRITAIQADGGTVIHIACRDLRERRETERRLREARQWEALGTLAGGLAHDFNNLLTAMMGNASLAREMLPPTHESAGLLDNVISAGARSANLIELMLAAAGYRRKFAFTIDPGPLLESAIARLEVPEGVRIVKHVLPCSFVGEHGSLQRLLVCLLENAVESYETGQGEVLVEIGAAEWSQPEPGDFEEGDCEGPCLHIVIADHGAGMDSETLERAFDPFFTTKFTGRGLGLAAVRGLVRAYSGRLWLRSRRGQGTRVEVWLPEKQSQA